MSSLDRGGLAAPSVVRGSIRGIAGEARLWDDTVPASLDSPGGVEPFLRTLRGLEIVELQGLALLQEFFGWDRSQADIGTP
jgi:hypothetical protein